MLDAIHQDLLNGNAAAAEQKARELLEQRPKDSEVYRVLAAAQAMGGNADGAKETINQGLSAMPDDAALNFAQAGLYLDAGDFAQAGPQLDQVIKLDPNFFPAYILQAQLAMSQGNVDEAERVVRVATRISPDHPQLHVIEGQAALARGDNDRAVQFLSAAAQQLPGDARVLRSLGMAYMAKEHYAFAEQTFRNLVEKDPANYDVRTMLIDAIRAQGRPADALKVAEPMATDNAPAKVIANTGILALEAGEIDRGMEWLESGVRKDPTDANALGALIQAWGGTNQLERGRTFVAQELDKDDQNPLLWQAALSTEEFASDKAIELIERWMKAVPTAIEPLLARIVVHDTRGETEQGDALASKIAAMQPMHLDAQLRLFTRILETDPDAAVTRAQELQEQFRGQHGAIDDQLRGLYSTALDRAGRYAEAADIWQQVHAEGASQRLPLTQPGTPRTADEWTALQADEPIADAMPSAVGDRHQFLWGPPGSYPEYVGHTLGTSQVAVLTDRFSNNPPQDFLQTYNAIQLLDKAAGEQGIDAETIGKLAAEWKNGLANRGVADTMPATDVLLLWDNNYLQVLRAHPNSTQLLLTVMDPRDMLLQWLAYPGSTPYQMPTVVEGATWMAAICNQIADIVDQNLFPHRIVRMDQAVVDELALQTAVSSALGAPVAALPPGTVAGQTLAPGHWRHYAAVLPEAFGLLDDVAVRLGYPKA